MYGKGFIFIKIILIATVGVDRGAGMLGASFDTAFYIGAFIPKVLRSIAITKDCRVLG
jgi:hypothetical protein